MTDVLVTGSEGFIGTHLVDALVDSGHDVDTLDIAGDPDHVGRVSEFDRYDAYDRIYHLAAMSDIRTCEANPGETWRTNVSGTFHLVSTLEADQHLIFPSTDHVYRPNDAVDDNHGSITASERAHPRSFPAGIDETGPVRPESLYGLSKLLGERVIQYFARTVGFDHHIYRLFSVYGPGQRRGWLVPDVIDKCWTQETVAIRDPAVQQSMTFIDDVIDVLAGAVGPSGTYNVCSPSCRSVADVYRAIARAVDEHTGSETAFTVEPGKEKDTCGDNTKIEQYYADWMPFEAGIEATVEAYL